jgi:dTDP-4-dehydrorhamnose reductase
VHVLVTGAAGFVGSNVAAVAADLGHAVTCAVRAPPATTDPRCRYAVVDLVDAEATRALVGNAAPDVVVHTAILNDLDRMLADRRLAWATYVESTRTLVDAANGVGAALAYVSTDWVFDGTQPLADEATPPNPVNLYGFLKAASELVVLERAQDPLVARISAVMGRNRAGPASPRAQDYGFGYFVASLVDALSAGHPFTVWEADTINMVATPSLASVSAEWMLALASSGARGIFHCCGRDAVTRLELAHAAAAVFGLDAQLIRTGPPEPVPIVPIPYDTSLGASATAAALGREPPSLDELLRAFRAELGDLGSL